MSIIIITSGSVKPEGGQNISVDLRNSRSVEPRAGQDISVTLRTSRSAGNSDFLISSFLFHLTPFFPVLSQHKLTCNKSNE